MYAVDWFLFYERGKVKWYYPIISVAFPLAYVAYIYIRAAIWNFDSTSAYLYPYFFLNIDSIGATSVLKWIMVLLIAFIIAGYVIYGIDRAIKTKK